MIRPLRALVLAGLLALLGSPAAAEPPLHAAPSVERLHPIPGALQARSRMASFGQPARRNIHCCVRQR